MIGCAGTWQIAATSRQSSASDKTTKLDTLIQGNKPVVCRMQQRQPRQPVSWVRARPVVDSLEGQQRRSQTPHLKVQAWKFCFAISAVMLGPSLAFAAAKDLSSTSMAS